MSLQESTTTTTTTTAATSPVVRGPSMKSRRHPRRPLTNTNTDDLSCSKDSWWLNLWMYRFNLWTGLYMLNPYERLIFHLVGWFAFIVSMLYIYVFWKGFVEGFQQQQHGSTPVLIMA
jgi:hypothetical protein